MPITHPFVSEKADGADPTLLRASDWNAGHDLDVAAPAGLTGATTAARFVGGTTSGAPVTGTFAVGDYVVAQDGKIHICTVAGSPGTWVAVSGGDDLVQVATGAGSVRIPGLSASSDRLPGSPSAYDDEFGSLVGWSDLGTLDTLNVTDAASHLHMKHAASNAFYVWGIYKECPSMPFTVTAKFTDFAFYQNYQWSGLLLGETSPGKLAGFGNCHVNGTDYWSWYTWTSRTGGRSGIDDIGGAGLRQYIRFVVSSSTDVTCQMSSEGLIWQTVHASHNPGFTIGSVGVGVATHDTASNTLEAFVDWIRFT
jgi:hypothetical protein